MTFLESVLPSPGNLPALQWSLRLWFSCHLDWDDYQICIFLYPWAHFQNTELHIIQLFECIICSSLPTSARLPSPLMSPGPPAHSWHTSSFPYSSLTPPFRHWPGCINCSFLILGSVLSYLWQLRPQPGAGRRRHAWLCSINPSAGLCTLAVPLLPTLITHATFSPSYEPLYRSSS